MNRRGILTTVSIGTILLIVGCLTLRVYKPIQGQVIDNNGPLAGAIVRVQTTENTTTTDNDGHFILTGLTSEEEVFVTAWASGYYIVGENASPGNVDVELHLHPHSSEDNPDYKWLPSQYHPGQGEDQGCAECHSAEGADLQFLLPVDEWLLDAHSQSAVNPRFLTMYTGTDLVGNKSPDTRYGISRDYGRFPLRPDLDQSYFGPGYKLDFPETAGNCAACHTPAASFNNPYGVDPTSVSDVPAEGIPCDFCHKIWDVSFDPFTNMPFPNMPGVLSYEFRRPSEGHQFFAGPFDDVAPGEDTYSPLQTQSQICAPCHFGVFWDTVVYNSFGEWLESTYSDPDSGKTCQDCHMPKIGATHFVRPEKGGLARDPDTIFSHRMPGAGDEKLLQNAVSLDVEVRPDDDQLLITVTITNDKTGHHVPTDSPLRHMILLVMVTDEQGAAVEQLDGPVLPEWGGVGDPNDGYYAGLPGKAFAKLLEELWTEVSPTGAYWNPTRVISDNRIAAFDIDTSNYLFSIPDEVEMTIEVTLLFRRAFIQLMDQKGWADPDIVMAHQIIFLTGNDNE